MNWENVKDWWKVHGLDTLVILLLGVTFGWVLLHFLNVILLADAWGWLAIVTAGVAAYWWWTSKDIDGC